MRVHHCSLFVLGFSALSCSDRGAPGEEATGKAQSPATVVVTCATASPTTAFTRFHVKDSSTSNRPVPCVHFKSYVTGNYQFQTDINGNAIFYEPELMGTTVTFSVRHETQNAALFPDQGGWPVAYEVNVQAGKVCTIVASAPYTAAGSDCNEGPSQTALNTTTVPGGSQRVRVRVRDADTNRPLPAARLTSSTLGGRSYMTDATGEAALHSATMNVNASFVIDAPGYQSAAHTIPMTPGSTFGTIITLQPLPGQLAQPLYRMTGAGKRREATLLSNPVPTTIPVANGDVIGQDGPMATLFKNQVYWTFGDTIHLDLDEKNLGGSGAFSANPGTPLTSVNLTYYQTAAGIGERAIAPKAKYNPMDTDPPESFFEEPPVLVSGAEALRWPFGLTSWGTGTSERMYTWVNVIDGAYNIYYVGIGRFNETKKRFEKIGSITAERDPFNHGTKWNRTVPSEHSFKVTTTDHVETPAGTRDFVYFSNLVRVRATETALTSEGSYQRYTAFKNNLAEVDRHPDLRVKYSWQAGREEFSTGSSTQCLYYLADPVGNAEYEGYCNLDSSEALTGHLRSIETGSATPHPVASEKVNRNFNRYRNRYTDVIGEAGLRRTLWYAEADTPMGPQAYAKQIVNTHAAGVNAPINYEVYNAHQVPLFAQDRNGTQNLSGERLFFAAVFGSIHGNDTTAPSKPLPFNDYNVMMHAVDLDEIFLPVPIYEMRGVTETCPTCPTGSYTRLPLLGKKEAVRPGTPGELPVPFYAYDRTGTTMPQLRPAYWSTASCRPGRKLEVMATATSPTNRYEPDFYVVDINAPNAPQDSRRLYEYTHNSDPTRRAYVVEGQTAPAGYTQGAAMGRVFQNPTSKVWIPIPQYLGEVVADAGPDQCLVTSSPGGTAAVTVSAVNSLPTTGTKTYAWKLNGVTQGSTTATLGATLGAGLHFVELKVTSNGITSTDKMLVEVAATTEITGSPGPDGKVVCHPQTGSCLINDFDTGASALQIGDSASGYDIRSITSFDTSGLNTLNGEVIVAGAKVLLKSSGSVGTAPTMKMDIANGWFGTMQGLEAADFSGQPSNGADVATVTEASSVFTGTIAKTAWPYVHNASAVTQVRLRSATAPNGNSLDDQRGFYSAEFVTAADRPKLRVSYWLCDACQ